MSRHLFVKRFLFNIENLVLRDRSVPSVAGLSVKIASRFGVLEYWGNRNSKLQNPNNKQITMTKIQNSKPQHHPNKRNSKYVWVIKYWNLRFICNLVLEIWYFTLLRRSNTPADSRLRVWILCSDLPCKLLKKCLPNFTGFWICSMESYLGGNSAPLRKSGHRHCS